MNRRKKHSKSSTASSRMPQKLLPFKVPIIGHRGLTSPSIIENTIASVMGAFNLSGGSEIDIQMTRDGQLVVLHDATLERTLKEAGVETSDPRNRWDISRLSYDEVLEICVDSQATPPLLSELLVKMSACESARNLLIEIKSNLDSLPILAEILKPYSDLLNTSSKRVSIICDNTEILAKSRKDEVLGGFDHYYVVDPKHNYEEALKFVAEQKLRGLDFMASNKVTHELVTRAKEAGLNVITWPYTSRYKDSDNRRIIEHMIAIGVDMITTDYPPDIFEDQD